jgi:hypothetical protein
MKKLVVGLMLVLGISTTAFAQVSSSDDAAVNVNAYVIRTITADVVKGLEVGNVTAGMAKTITVEEAEAAEVSIFSTNRNTPFLITVSAPTVLTTEGTAPGETATLPITFFYKGSAVAGSKTGLFNVVPGDGGEYSTGPASAFGPILRSLYIGATVTPAEDQQGGAYVGQIIVSVATN